MSSNKSTGVNLYFLKKQLETAAKESVAKSGSKLVSTSLFSDELISSKAIARTFKETCSEINSKSFNHRHHANASS
jgi:hypothetical protein